MNRKQRKSIPESSYSFYPYREALLVFWIIIIFILSPGFVMLFFVKIHFAIAAFMVLGFFAILFVIVYKTPSFSHKITVDYSGITAEDTRTGDIIYQPWSIIAVIYRTHPPKGPGLLIFSLSELTEDNLKSLIKSNTTTLGKPLLSVDGNILFPPTANPKKYMKYISFYLRTTITDVHVNFKDEYKIKR